MNTPSHLIMTAAIRKANPGLAIVGSAALLGSIAPDLPLYALTFGGWVFFRATTEWSVGEIMRHMFDRLYFEDLVWIAAHNFLHAPIVLALGLFLVRPRAGGSSAIATWLWWFLAACMLHSTVDIATHNDDGPLVFFPFDWRVRFVSPVSYWDSDHFGRQFFVFEFIFDGVLLVYLMKGALARWAAKLGLSSAALAAPSAELSEAEPTEKNQER